MISQSAHRSLSDTLNALKITAKDALQWPSSALQNPDNLLRNLIKVIDEIGLQPSSRPTPRRDYVEQWHDFQNGRQEQVSNRALRYLCWEPEISTSNPFKMHLQKLGVPLTARFIQGLVYSCHDRWSREFAKGLIAHWVLDAIRNYEGHNRLVNRWKDSAEMILGAHGPLAFAKELSKEKTKINEFCEIWRVDEKSAYIQESIRSCAVYCRNQAKLNQYFIDEVLPWRLWPLEAFKTAISETILTASEKGPKFVEALQHFVREDERLLDPRLPRNAKNWVGISEKARLLFIQWLSREDIKFFFDHVLPKGHDPHGRKNFWLLYESRIRMSRPLLNPKDAMRLRYIAPQNRITVGNFGSIKENTSAFLLDFGSVLVVEFSETGNACYVYDNRNVDKIAPDFWKIRPFTFLNLKNPDICEEKIVHRAGWQDKMSDILNRFGIRKGASR